MLIIKRPGYFSLSLGIVPSNLKHLSIPGFKGLVSPTNGHHKPTVIFGKMCQHFKVINSIIIQFYR